MTCVVTFTMSIFSDLSDHQQIRRSSNQIKSFVGILRLPEILEYRTLLLIYSALNFGTNLDLLSYLQRSCSFHSHLTRYCTDLVICHFYLTKTQLSMLFVGAKFWNALPQHSKSLVSLSIFERRVKEHLINTYTCFPWCIHGFCWISLFPYFTGLLGGWSCSIYVFILIDMIQCICSYLSFFLSRLP